MALKICVVTNYYPPYFIGGYELGCRDVVEALKNRGHQVRVLTSTYKVDQPQTDGEIYRWLEPGEWWTPNYLRGLAGVLKKEKANQQAFRQLCAEFEPDLIYVWNPVGISLSIVSVAQQLGLPVCYFVSDHWLEEWEKDPGYQMWQKQAAGLRRPFLWKGILNLLNALHLTNPPAPPVLSNVQFASECLKRNALQKGRPVAKAEVIHWGVNADQFRFTEKPDEPTRLLFVGQLTPHKGVHTAVEAMRLLKENGHKSITLTIVGDSVLTDFKAQLKQAVTANKLEQQVRFVGQVRREEMPQFYEDHDVLIFPSVWDEPFSITVVEAMASGLAVVGTATGGSDEILENGVNALVFEKENAEECAACLSTLLTDKELFERVRRQGRLTVEQKYRLEQMVDRIEHSLKEVAAQSSSPDITPSRVSAYESVACPGQKERTTVSVEDQYLQ
ncbi:MAG TPA: glycosyltransferase family 4 protein [Pyrinomonadaceae bacterium]